MTPAAPTPNADRKVQERARSVQIALAFLLGIALTLIAVKLTQGRATHPLETQPLLGYRLDLNRATPTELMQLPRVGPSLAGRITDARPFESMDDLRRVSGVGPATLEKIKPYVSVTDGVSYSAKRTAGEPIDPNTATFEELQSLPGVGPKMAQRIIDAREKRPFATIDDLRRVSGIGPKTLEKLRGRVVIGDLRKFDSP